MMPIKYMGALLNKYGHDIKIRTYVRPSTGYEVHYIEEIDGKRYFTNQQAEAKRILEQLLEAEEAYDK